MRNATTNNRAVPDNSGAALTLQHLSAVLSARGIGRTKHYDDIRNGLWTNPIPLGRHRSAWPSHEVQVLIVATIAGARNDEIRKLVNLLHQRRQSEFSAVRSRYLLPSTGEAA